MKIKVLKKFIIIFLICMVLVIGTTSSKKPDKSDDSQVHDNTRDILAYYPTFSEIKNTLQEINNDYPDITELYSLGKTDFLSRDIWCLEITDNPSDDEGEPGILFTGLTHANEWPTISICLSIAEQLTSKYNSNPNVKNVIDNRRLWIVPCMNPDGYYYSREFLDYPLGLLWRKNMRDNNNNEYFDEDYDGIDLNRNFEGSCNGNMWGAWGSTVSEYVSHYPGHARYCGPSPGSEKETQAIMSLFMENNICASINWHTYGEYVCWPWAYTTGITPDNSYYKYVGEQIAERIGKVVGDESYNAQQSGIENKITGNVNDWSYGHGHYVQGQPTFSYVIEAASTLVPVSQEVLDFICAENYKGALYLLQEAENINNISTRVLPPVIDDMTCNPDGDYQISWKEQNPDEKYGRSRFWVETPDDIEDDKKIWMYYGNTDTSPVSDGANTWDYYLDWSSDHTSNFTLSKAHSNRHWTRAIDTGINFTTAEGYRLLHYTAVKYTAINEWGVGAGTALVDVLNKTAYSYRAGESANNFINHHMEIDADYSPQSYLTRVRSVNDTSTGALSHQNYAYVQNDWNVWEVLATSNNVNFNLYNGISNGAKLTNIILTNNISEGNLRYFSYIANCRDSASPTDYWSYKDGNDAIQWGAHAANRGTLKLQNKWVAIGKYQSPEPSWNSFGNGEELSGSSENWWNTNWSHRKLINISDAINGYQMGIDIGYNTSGNVSCDGFCQIDFDDIRFIDYDNNTELDFWREDYPVYFQLDEIKNHSYTIDDVEKGKIFWNFDGFDISNEEKHSGNYSFKSHQSGNNKVSAMTTKNPIPITEGIKLSFWCLYDIEDDWDYAFVEVSKDGRYYKILDKFTGYSSGWKYKEYYLNNYIDESIFIRFRYTTDSNTQEEGFYIDDIMPISDFGNISTISTSITDNQYNLEGRTHGEYFYRVRGYNSNRGWGDFSTIEKMIVNEPPNTPSNPEPVNGAIFDFYNDDLSWNCSDPDDDPLTYDVYFGTSSPPPLVSSGQSTNTYNPGTLDLDQTYYWKIIAYDNYEASNTSPIWEFEIKKDITQPEWRNQGQNKIYVMPNESISLYVEGRDNVALYWAWLATNETGEWQNYTKRWWNDNWNYCKQLNISNHYSDYQIRLKVYKNDSHDNPQEGLIDCEGHCKDDFSDIRFIDNFGNELKYWQEEDFKQSNWSYFFIKTPTINTNHIFIYYGNINATSKSNGSETFPIYFDDWSYDHTSDWTHWDYDWGSGGKEWKRGGWTYNLSSSINRGHKIIAKIREDGTWDTDEKGGDLYLRLSDGSFSGNITNGIKYCITNDEGTNGVDNNHFGLLSQSEKNNVGYSDGTWNTPTVTTEWLLLEMNYTENDVSYYLAYYNTNNYFDNDIATINSSEIPNNGTLDAIDWYYYHGQWGEVDHHFIHENNDNCQVYVKRDDSGPSEMAWEADWMAIANCVHPSPYWSDYSNEFQNNYCLNKYESPTKMQENNLWQWSNFTWQNSSIPNGTNIGWRIYYIDTSGNVNCTDIMSFSIGQEIISVDISLCEGWNLITIPVENDLWASTLAENITGCNMVSWFNCSIQQYDSYIVGGPPQFDFPILDGYGYFVLVNQSSIFSISGYRISDAYVPLCTGWNMIGWYHENDTMASYLAENITNCSMVSWFNCSNQEFDNYIVGGPPQFDFIITQGMGIFVLIELDKSLKMQNVFPELPEIDNISNYKVLKISKMSKTIGR